MTGSANIPAAQYGVFLRDNFDSVAAQNAEQLRRMGYVLVESHYSAYELEQLSASFEAARRDYIAQHGEDRLKGLGELHTMRLLLSHGGSAFLELALNPSLLAVLREIFLGKFVLSQQNGVINPARETYSQASWHRDLPYQHFVSSRPLAVNALFCVDDFTLENGATFVLPASHQAEAFPSEDYVQRNAVQIEAKAGQFLLMDCMVFHSGGFNQTARQRRAVNHVYGIPYFRPHIDIPANVPTTARALSAAERDLLGFADVTPASVADYLAGRERRKA